jgi:hypothetical protein
LDSYNFDLRPENYFNYIDITPARENITEPWGVPNVTVANETLPNNTWAGLETGGRIFGKINSKQLMRATSKKLDVTNVTNPDSYFNETENTINYTVNCTNGTHWNGTQCQNHTTVWKTYPQNGIATFLIFPQAVAGQDGIILGAPFLNDFYQVYNLDKNTIGLVPSI